MSESSVAVAEVVLAQSTFSSSFSFRFLEGEAGRVWTVVASLPSLLPSGRDLEGTIPGLVALAKALMAAWRRGREERVEAARVGIAVSDGGA